MLEKILPRYIDNHFQGQKLAVWFFVLIVAFKTVQSLAVVFGGSFVITSADGIPLDTYSPAAGQTVVSLWALLGLTRFWICFLCVLVLFRYRSLLSFMFVILLLSDLGRILVLHYIPIVRTGSPMGPTVNLVLFTLTIVGLVLSLWAKNHQPEQSA